MISLIRRLVLFVILVVMAGCSGAVTEPVAKDIPALERQLVSSPGNPVVLRDLGIAHLDAGNTDIAAGYLAEAYEIAPMDPKIALNYGLTLEAQQRPAAAIEVYRTHTSLNRSSKYTRLMEGRYLAVRQQVLRQEISELAKIETSGQLTEGRMVAEAVAVFPFDYLGSDSRYAAVGRGLSSFIIADLGQVGGLRLLERERLQVLLDEIALGQTDYVATDTAPRTGRILGAGRVVGGSFDVLQGQRLNVDTGYWDLSNQQTDFLPETGVLDDIFRIQKSLVFGLLDRMNITLTTSERNAIERYPTRDLQAFMFYCRGLLDEDNGNYLSAVQNYEQAVKTDPGFAEAEAKRQTAQSRAAAGNSWQNTNFGYDFGLGGISQSEIVSVNLLVEERLRILGIGTGFPFVQGEEMKKGFEDITVKSLERLPDPPDPPNGTGGSF